MPKLASPPDNEPNSPILIVSWENAEPAPARMTPKTRRNRRFIIGAGLLAIGAKTARTLNVERSTFTVHRSPVTVRRSPFGVRRSALHRAQFEKSKRKSSCDKGGTRTVAACSVLKEQSGTLRPSAPPNAKRQTLNVER